MGIYLFDFEGAPVDAMPIYASMMLGILDAYRVVQDIIRSTTKADP